MSGKMIFGSVLVFCLTVALVHGSPCTNLTGVWRNELGSNMTIAYVSESASLLTGQYSTSVESSRGAASISSPIAGSIKTVNGGSLVAFNVLWNNGASLTAWVGQCIVCDGKEKLFTTWVLRSLRSPGKKWMTTMINQDTFWRLQDVDVPPTQEGSSETTVNTALLGAWTSASGDALNITHATKSGPLHGQHISPAEEDVPPSGIFGTTDGNQTFTALGFSSVGSTLISGWAGHIYNPEDPKPVMETSWLSHGFSDSCKNPRRFVQYGMNNYTQTM